MSDGVGSLTILDEDEFERVVDELSLIRWDRDQVPDLRHILHRELGEKKMKHDTG